MIDLKELEEKLLNINENLKDKYSPYFNRNKEEFKEKLKSLGSFFKINKLEKNSLKNIGDIVGVDGSVNRVGGAYPHYIEIFQGLAKSTDGKETLINKIYTPTLESEYKDENTRDKFLAKIEVEVAIDFIEKYNPKIIMMDGGFIRYKINCKQDFTKLRELCEMKNIILFGVIKDIKTNIISRALDFDSSVYDREILFNRFEIGELFIVNDDVNRKYLEEGDGFASAFLRSSSFPGVIGIDILDFQEDKLLKVSELIYSLTPEHSRGVPIWLDIVDKDVKITDEMIRTLLESFLDRDIYERFFISERDKRTI